MIPKIIEYKEIPVTREEVHIAKTLETLIRAVNAKNLILFASLFSDNALFLSFEHDGKVSSNKEEYMRRQMPKNLAGVERLLYYKNVLIRILDKTHAVASGTSFILLKNGGIISRDRLFKFAFESNKWCITELTLY